MRHNLDDIWQEYYMIKDQPDLEEEAPNIFEAISPLSVKRLAEKILEVEDGKQ
jgi:hypothetical protein